MDKFKILLSGINNAIKDLGFKKNGSNFYYNSDGNIGVINLQKSKDSSSEITVFTINIGVYSNSLKIFDQPGIKSKPLVADCHWRQRIGFLLPERKDYWWHINDNISLDYLITEVTNILISIAIPEILIHITDKSLEEKWMNRISAGLTEQQMYLYLIALLKARDSHDLGKKIEELKSLSKGKPFEQNIKDCLLDLGINA